VTTASYSPAPFWLLGAGNMGGALLRRWVEAGLDPVGVTAIDPGSPALSAGVRHLAAIPADGEAPATLMLAVKPQLLDALSPTLAPLVGPETLLISILAGVEIESLRARFPHARRILRVMPNTPVAIGKGVMALHGHGIDAGEAAAIEAWMRPLGLVEWIADEALFNAVTALSGSGPAFLFRFIDAMAKAGAALGLPADQAARMALATVEGAAGLAAIADEPPAVLADRVASPRGTTRAGLDVLDADAAIDRLVGDTLGAAERRGAELAAEARGR